MSISPAMVSAASDAACTSASACAPMAMRLRSTRSAMAPPMGPSSSAGARSANTMMPSQVPERVNSQVSQPTATRCTHSPTRLSALPMA